MPLLDANDPIPVEELLKHAGWLRRLARSLVHDALRAEDLVQETWVAALEHPPRKASWPAPWLARVLRNLANRSHRDEYSRLRHELHASQKTPVSTDPQILVERAEVHRKIVEAVIGLEEPYRSTILLRFFEDLRPREIARRQGVPVATVRTRLSRGLERLRARLKPALGGDGAWYGALAPLAGLRDLPLASGARAVPATTATASAGGIAASTVIPGLNVVGVIMAQKAVLSVSLGIIVTLGVGLAVGSRMAHVGPEEARSRYALVDAADHEALKVRHEALNKELAASRTAREEAAEAGQRLETQVASLEGELKKLREEAVERDRVTTAGGGLRAEDAKALEEELQRLVIASKRRIMSRTNQLTVMLRRSLEELGLEKVPDLEALYENSGEGTSFPAWLLDWCLSDPTIHPQGTTLRDDEKQEIEKRLSLNVEKISFAAGRIDLLLALGTIWKGGDAVRSLENHHALPPQEGGEDEVIQSVPLGDEDFVITQRDLPGIDFFKLEKDLAVLEAIREAKEFLGSSR